MILRSRENCAPWILGLKKSWFEERSCKIIYFPAGYNVGEVSHVNVIFARIVTTAADRRAFASEFISKITRENLCNVCLANNIVLNFYLGADILVRIAEINHEKAFQK